MWADKEDQLTQKEFDEYLQNGNSDCFGGNDKCVTRNY
jgi:hypothetical protein